MIFITVDIFKHTAKKIRKLNEQIKFYLKCMIFGFRLYVIRICKSKKDRQHNGQKKRFKVQTKRLLLDFNFYMFCRSLFVLFLLVIVLSVLLRFTDSYYPFGIFKLFLYSYYRIKMKTYSSFKILIIAAVQSLALIS